MLAALQPTAAPAAAPHRRDPSAVGFDALCQAAAVLSSLDVHEGTLYGRTFPSVCVRLRLWAAVQELRFKVNAYTDRERRDSAWRAMVYFLLALSGL